MEYLKQSTLFGGMSNSVQKLWTVEAVAGDERTLTAINGERARDNSHSVLPSLARIEWDYINRVLELCNGNVSQAASVLGLHRRSLQRKLRRLPPRW